MDCHCLIYNTFLIINFLIPFFFLFRLWKKKKNGVCVCVYRRRKKMREWCGGLWVGLSGACRPCQLSFCRQVFSFWLFFHVGWREGTLHVREEEEKKQKTKRVSPFSRTLWWGQTGGLFFLLLLLLEHFTQTHQKAHKTIKDVKQPFFLSSVTVCLWALEWISFFLSTRFLLFFF